jgi:hypothetical protein
MKPKVKRKGKERAERMPRIELERLSSAFYGAEGVPVHGDVEGAISSSVSRIVGYLVQMSPNEEDARILGEIDGALREIKRLSSEAHVHDEEMARLRKETRGLIDEMMRDLNLKAA